MDRLQKFKNAISDAPRYFLPRVGMDWHINLTNQIFLSEDAFSWGQESVSAMYGKMDSLSRFVSSSGSSVPFLLAEPIFITQSS